MDGGDGMQGKITTEQYIEMLKEQYNYDELNEKLKKTIEYVRTHKYEDIE